MTCPSWCVGDPTPGDHLADPGSSAWPSVRATPYEAHDLTAAPTWCEVEGMQPAVLLDVRPVDEDHRTLVIDLAPSEARALADQLRKAATVVEAG